MALLCFQIYNKEPKLCVLSHLTEYLKRKKSYRDTDKLFLTCIKPYKAANKDTISKWCKSISKESGISIHSQTSHSSRDAASSYAKSHGASLSTIIERASWKPQRTFVQFYEKQVKEEEIEEKLLAAGKLNFTKKLERFIYIKSIYRIRIVKELSYW